MSLYNSDQASERGHLLRKIVLLLLLVVALALGLVILFQQKNNNFPLLLFNVLADASLGLIVGLGVRMALRHRNWFLQGVVAAALSLIGLFILGYFTDWKSGVGPLQIGLVKVNWLNWAHVNLRLPLQFGRSQMDLLDLAHMVVAVDGSWIALRAWKRSPRVVGQSSPSVSSRRVRKSRAQSSSSSAHPARARSLSPSVLAERVQAPVVRARPKVRKRKSGRLISEPSAAPLRPIRPKTSQRQSLSHRHKPEVQLAVYEEHRCPYCLEVVNRNDPRGVVECQVCHTLHHKDCWDITGTCQVPHLNG